MKLKETLKENKGAFASLLGGLALAGFGAYKAFFGKDEPNDDECDGIEETAEESDSSTDEAPEEATDQPE